VVVENVERHLEHGMDPREAAHATMDEVGGALIAIALVLASVFIPAAFIAGVSGQFYRQFALTIASATVISLIVSLTLSPAMAALLLRPRQPNRRGPAWTRVLSRGGAMFNRNFDRLSRGYGRMTGRLVGLVGVMLVIYVVLIGLTAWRIMATPVGFIPAQDQGNVIMSAKLPGGASLARTDAVVRKTIPLALGVPGIIGASSYAGVEATTQTTDASAGQAYLIESSFEDRAKHHVTLSGMIANLQKALSAIPGAAIRILPPPPVRGIGTQGGVKLIVEDRTGVGNDYGRLEAVTKTLVDAINKDPDVTGAYETFNTSSPRVHADIDRVKAEYLGVSDASVFDTLDTFLGSSYVDDFNYLNHTYTVYAQADAPYRQDDSQILQLQTRSANGAMMPLGAVVNLNRTTGPYRVLRYQLYPSAEVQANTPSGKSTGQTMAAIERVAQKTLPPGFFYDWTELAYQQQAAGNTASLVFALAVTLVFLLLAALYESVTMPLAVILIVPMCLLAAITGVNIMGLDNNILTQIGFIVLIGLAAKNAILIVEFARQGELDQGHAAGEAAVEAATTRLRPILMTSFAFILGVVPLAFASGAGAELRQALGVAVFFGMIGVTGFGLLFTPVFYVATRWLSSKVPQPPTRDGAGRAAAARPDP
jgi:HAE1 family hydrophobic/amphiphilic exporter-1